MRDGWFARVMRPVKEQVQNGKKRNGTQRYGYQHATHQYKKNFSAMPVSGWNEEVREVGPNVTENVIV